MLTSFGYFEEPEDDILVLKNLFTNLKPGGFCVIDVMGKEILSKIYQATTSDQTSDGTLMIVRHKIMKEWTRMGNEWIFACDGKTKTFQVEHAIYSGLELKERMEQVGFKEIDLYGDFDGNEYGYDAQRLIAVGKRPND